jgi:hypothetical protein
MGTNFRTHALVWLALPVVALIREPSASAQQAPSAGFPVEDAPAAPPSAAPPAAPTAAPPAAPPPPASPAPAAPTPPPATPAPDSSTVPAAPAAPAPTPAEPPKAPAVPAPPAPAPAEPTTSFGAPPPDDAGALVHRPVLVEIGLEDEPGWSIGVDAYAGLSTLFGTDTRGAYSLAGGILRGRFRYYEGGVYYEATDTLSGGGDWQNVGGFAGAWLPYRNWVDFEIAARLGARRYSDDDLRFGPSGYELWSPTLGLVLGVSDRASKGRWGGRIGSQLVATYDLKQRDRPWELSSVDPDTGVQSVASGKSHVGGFSIQLVVTLGFDAGEGA